MFIKLGDEDYVDPDEVEFFYVDGSWVKLFFKSGQSTYIKNMTMDAVAAVLNEAKDPF